MLLSFAKDIHLKVGKSRYSLHLIHFDKILISFTQYDSEIMATSRNRPYKVVHAFLFCYRDDDTKFYKQIAQLGTVLTETLVLTSVTKRQISYKRMKSLRKMYAIWEEWVLKHKGPDNLLIVYYNGHGVVDRDGTSGLILLPALVPIIQ